MRPSLLQAFLAGVVCAAAGCGPAPEKPIPAVPPARPLPQVSGTIEVDGLTAPVRIVRDRWGIPHIAAETEEDLFFAQGFVQAQDRLFQMDLWRRSALGRLSEVLGANFIERDAMTRRIQYRGDPEAEWASYGPGVKAIATAFTRGINAWIGVAGDRLPEAFALAGWRPEAWKAEDLLNRTDAFVAGANARDEVFRAQLVAALGPATVDHLFPLPTGARTVVPRDLDPALVSPMVADLLLRVGARPFFSGFAAPFARSGSDPDLDRDRGLTPIFGSNAWAVAPRRSATGAPLLAVDPHRPLDTPSLRYLVHLKAPGWNVAGATAPWLPGVVIGHNDSIAWGMTALAADTQDIFVETLNPANPRQVRERSRWVDVVVEKDAIAVKRREPFEYERLSTRRGVVVAVDPDRHLAYTLRWSGAAPGGAAELASLPLGRAASVTEFRAALNRWRTPPAEFVYADRQGHIALQKAAAVPVRRGWDGSLPAPAWTGDHDWRAPTPTDRPADMVDPAAGFAISANESAPRLHRIRDVLSGDRRFGLDDFKRLQHDTYAWNADRLIPLLARASGGQGDAEAARGRLLRWNKQVSAASADAALYVAWEQALARQLAALRIPAALVDRAAANMSPVLLAAVSMPSAGWFGDDPVKRRDNLMLEALAAAAAETRQPALRVITFVHPLALTEPARRRFNVGPVAIGGYAETVRAISISPPVGASFQAIFDLSDWDRSVVINAPGQSEWPGSAHFSDLARLWASEEYVPLVFSDRAVAANAEATLTLLPKTVP